MLKTTKPPRSQKGMRRLLKWYEKKGRPITRTVILYRSEPLARNFIRTQHQALTLGTKRASALGAATLERETRNAEKEQHYQHLPLLAAIHNLISTAVSDTNAAQPITHNICRFSDLQRRVLHFRLPQIIRDLCPNHHGTLGHSSRHLASKVTLHKTEPPRFRRYAAVFVHPLGERK